MTLGVILFGTDGWSHVIGAPSRHVGSKTKPTDGHVLREGGLEKIPYCNLTPSLSFPSGQLGCRPVEHLANNCNITNYHIW